MKRLQVEATRITGEGIEAKISGQWLLIIKWEFSPDGVEGSIGIEESFTGVDGMKNAQPGDG